ncbi:hypothetical protein FTO70_10465 [Methanosarcina sp. KYL-1]|uniref:hypothetical protein n=1 Tax=Methanosarcina sp. KYL-1 TaxID=2602068 RepID=UPI0021010DC9|nr:hypothetical protein [Methanosarcina sp. KYL-1]MCQ1536094.1 hypothetical protein [Methanosarcina sp. KYL-1]
MPESWKKALNSYSYPVNLEDYKKAALFPSFFSEKIKGDRQSTINFENYFRELAPECIEVYFEVVFWKLYSQAHIKQSSTTRIVDSVLNEEIIAEDIWNVVQNFVRNQNRKNLGKIRDKLGITTRVLAVPLTFPAFADPERIPMIDNKVASWVNLNAEDHNRNRKDKLTLFKKNYTSLQENDFPNYLNWVSWCQEMAQVLTEMNEEKWRARDVEMAVFTAQREGINLNVIP